MGVDCYRGDSGYLYVPEKSILDVSSRSDGEESRSSFARKIENKKKPIKTELA